MGEAGAPLKPGFPNTPGSGVMRWKPDFGWGGIQMPLAVRNSQMSKLREGPPPRKSPASQSQERGSRHAPLQRHRSHEVSDMGRPRPGRRCPPGPVRSQRSRTQVHPRETPHPIRNLTLAGPAPPTRDDAVKPSAIGLVLYRGAPYLPDFGRCGTDRRTPSAERRAPSPPHFFVKSSSSGVPWLHVPSMCFPSERSLPS
jgi:hypothetical protein